MSGQDREYKGLKGLGHRLMATLGTFRWIARLRYRPERAKHHRPTPKVPKRACGHHHSARSMRRRRCQAR